MTTVQDCLVPVKVTCAPGLPVSCGGHCEYTLNIGIFFDGTGNNREADSGKDGQSNVARLYDAYREESAEGFFRHYIAGVGTPCKELGTSGKNPLEAAAGKGGQARILVGLLQIINSINIFINGPAKFSDAQIAALCSETWVRPDDPSRDLVPREEERILKALGLERGLVDNPGRGTFFAKLAGELSTKLADPKMPRKVTGIYIDVFGFSRGAAQARAFTTWLHDYLLFGATTSTDHNRELFGIASYVRLLGIFDTVASVGNPADPYKNHQNWAEPKNLHIHPAVRQCIHFAAMHELRSSFPLDSVCQENGVMPTNACERFYPGVHSDVGGGYAPFDQGKAISVTPQIGAAPKLDVDSKLKLSQLALNDMLAAARKSCVLHTYGDPWLKFDEPKADERRLEEQFAIDPSVLSSVTGYLKNCGIPELPKDKTLPVPELSVDQTLQRHGELYLAWRYQVSQKNAFTALTSVAYASRFDSAGYERLLHGERIFADQLTYVPNSAATEFEVDKKKGTYSRRAAEILTKIKAGKVPIHDSVPDFFDRFVHDSYADFVKKLGTIVASFAEHEGYIRYRIVYTGTATPLNVRLDMPQQTRMA